MIDRFSTVKAIAASMLSLSLAGCATSNDAINKCNASPELIFSTPAEKAHHHDRWHYAPAVRAGDLVIFSGVPVISLNANEAMDVERLKVEIAVAFESLGKTLNAAGGSLSDVVEIRTYHVFESEYFTGTKEEQLSALIAVKDSFIKPPYPAWTVLGIDELFLESAVMEIGLTAYLPNAGCAAPSPTR